MIAYSKIAIKCVSENQMRNVAAKLRVQGYTPMDYRPKKWREWAYITVNEPLKTYGNYKVELFGKEIISYSKLYLKDKQLRKNLKYSDTYCANWITSRFQGARVTQPISGYYRIDTDTEILSNLRKTPAAAWRNAYKLQIDQ